MRGERATMGKSLLDVQRELKIKAAYIAAIENADPTAFDTPGFIAGYVRSYARYLNMDPDIAFDAFCKESGFVTAHGMSAEASGRKGNMSTSVIASAGKDICGRVAACDGCTGCRAGLWRLDRAAGSSEGAVCARGADTGCRIRP